MCLDKRVHYIMSRLSSECNHTFPMGLPPIFDQYFNSREMEISAQEKADMKNELDQELKQSKKDANDDSLLGSAGKIRIDLKRTRQRKR
ncbi:MAG: hypothetical protein PWP62_2456 [Eubacteriaceae bacterium]|nr:hypothetical protein [Eubacteriaceae bacterium]